jgi:hypothetical protein
MTRVRIRGGYLNIGRRQRPGTGPVDPDYGVDEGTDPDYGVDEGSPGIDNELPTPTPPPGVWPPLTPEQPWRPIDPGFGSGRPPHVGGGPARPPRPGQPARPDQGLPSEGGERPTHPIFEPGTIWPPLPPGVSGTYWALVLIRGASGLHYRYVVVDADARPEHPIEEPDGEPPVAQPKKA